jgi:hypothetical protein
LHHFAAHHQSLLLGCFLLLAGVCSRTAVLSLLHAAEGRPRQLLVLMLLRALQQGSFGAGQLVLSFSQMPAGPELLRQHIKVRATTSCCCPGSASFQQCCCFVHIRFFLETRLLAWTRLAAGIAVHDLGLCAASIGVMQPMHLIMHLMTT